MLLMYVFLQIFKDHLVMNSFLVLMNHALDKLWGEDPLGLQPDRGRRPGADGYRVHRLLQGITDIIHQSILVILMRVKLTL